MYRPNQGAGVVVDEGKKGTPTAVRRIYLPGSSSIHRRFIALWLHVRMMK
jgi:hypothetical protein